MTTAQDRTPPDRPRRDRGSTFVEVLVAIVLLGTAVIATLTALRATVIATTIERDHAKAQQWLQSAASIIEHLDFEDCVSVASSGPIIRDAYFGDANAARPNGYDGGTLSLGVPEVWDGTQWIAFSAQGAECLDNHLLRQQRLMLEVRSPDGDIVENLQVVKRDR